MEVPQPVPVPAAAALTAAAPVTHDAFADIADGFAALLTIKDLILTAIATSFTFIFAFNFGDDLTNAWNGNMAKVNAEWTEA